MTERSFAWSGTTTGDAGPYSNTFFNRYIENLFTQADRGDAGVILGYDNGTNESLLVLESSPAAMSVDLQIGSALIQGIYYENDAELTHSITSNNDASGDDRIDSLILEVDYVNQTIRSDIIQGTVAPAPVAPTLTQTSSIYQIRIANITVQNLAVSILDADIDNTAREYAFLFPYQYGGTGVSSYVKHTSLNGLNSGALSSDVMTGFTVYSNTTGTTLTNGSWQTIDIDAKKDPDSLISLSSNQFTILEEGYYCMTNGLAIVQNVAAVGFILYTRLRNITQSTTELVQGRTAFGATAGIDRHPFGNTIFFANANDVFEIQGYATASTYRLSSVAVGGEAQESLSASFRRLTVES